MWTWKCALGSSSLISTKEELHSRKLNWKRNLLASNGVRAIVKCFCMKDIQVGRSEYVWRLWWIWSCEINTVCGVGGRRVAISLECSVRLGHSGFSFIVLPFALSTQNAIYLSGDEHVPWSEMEKKKWISNLVTQSFRGNLIPSHWFISLALVMMDFTVLCKKVG